MNAQPERLPNGEEPPLFVTVEYAARRLSMSARTLYRLIAEKKFPGRRIGGCVRIPYGELLRLVDPDPGKED